MQVPTILIVYRFNCYIKHDYLVAGYLMCHLLDGISHCARRIASQCYLILGCDNINNDNNILQRLVDLYIDHLLDIEEIYQVYNILKLEY